MSSSMLISRNHSQCFRQENQFSQNCILLSDFYTIPSGCTNITFTVRYIRSASKTSMESHNVRPISMSRRVLLRRPVNLREKKHKMISPFIIYSRVMLALSRILLSYPGRKVRPLNLQEDRSCSYSHSHKYLRPVLF